MEDQNISNEESVFKDPRENMELRYEPDFRIAASDGQALGRDECENMSISKDVSPCAPYINSQAVCDEKIGKLGPAEKVLSAANKDDARTESNLITEKEPTQVNEQSSTLSGSHANKNGKEVTVEEVSITNKRSGSRKKRTFWSKKNIVIASQGDAKKVEKTYKRKQLV